MRALISKEISEHGWVLAVMIPFAIFGYMLSLAVIMLDQASSPLESVRLFALTMVPILELILCNRLVVQEYSGKTQLFLESLPISRFSMLATKYVFGLALVIGAIGFCFMISVAVGWRSSTFGAKFLGIMTARWLVYAFVTFSFFFMMGLMGRYRIALYVAVIAAWYFLTSSTAFDSTVLGPFALVSDQFAYEREIVPVQNLVFCAVAGLVFCGLAAALGLVREGSIAGMMAEKMSYREKIFIAGLLLTAMLTAAVVDSKGQPEPYQMNGAVTQTGNGVEVQVQSVADHEVSFSLAQEIHQDLVLIANQLELINRPEMFVAHRSDLDADRYEIGDLSNARGTLMRANYSSAEFEYAAMRPTLIDLWLSESTRFAAVRERRCWVLEGFAEFWPRQNRTLDDAESPDSSELWRVELAVDRRAAYAGSLGITPQDIDAWYSYRERVGQPIVRSAACAGLVLAQERYGDERLGEFLKAMLGGNQHPDSRADVDQWLNPIDKVWQRTMGSDYDEFKRAWADELERLGARWATTLEAVPRLAATSQWQAESETSYRLTILPEVDVVPDVDVAEYVDEMEVHYQTLDVFDVWENDEQNQLQTDRWRPGEEIEVRRLFARGQRVRWTLATDSSVLECKVISGFRRQEVSR